jgi:hypothetical protein
MALSAASERLARLIELRAQLRDGSAQEFELGALLIAQVDAPIPSLIGLSHRPVFAVRRCAPARRGSCMAAAVTTAPVNDATSRGVWYRILRALGVGPGHGQPNRNRRAAVRPGLFVRSPIPEAGDHVSVAMVNA